uniref:Cellular communication network factor 1, like 2 n=1 Tax=Kryptolebias marmoratus TaxID=37003 RepID=A0A3Q3FQJ0_KRYMA
CAYKCIGKPLYEVGAVLSQPHSGECPSECFCSPSPVQCPPGVSWVTDHCGCCKVCARQFNEDCSATEPCDHIKGLRCHLGAGGNPKRGLCRAEAHGLPCTFNGRVYQHSEDFQPICQHQCTCMNGVVGCMPVCPYQVPLPRQSCTRPRLVKSEGGCCEEWVCDDDDNRISEDPREQQTDSSQPDSQPHSHPNHISLNLINSLNPLSLIPQCFLQTTEWTPCSTTCGMGISSRVTNNNTDCQMLRETRLCQIQQCELQPPVVKKGKKCQRTVRPQRAVRITFAGCLTVQRFRPHTCGTCTDGRCCTPSVTRTVRLLFRCSDKETFYNVMWIKRCHCSRSCHTDVQPSGSSVSLYNDIHTFKD